MIPGLSRGCGAASTPDSGAIGLRTGESTDSFPPQYDLNSIAVELPSLMSAILVGVAWFVVLMLLIFLPYFIGMEKKLRRIEARLELMTLKIDATTRHLGLAPAEAYLQRIDSLLEQGKKLEAIKVYRDNTGAGLAEAKEAVERRPWWQSRPGTPA